MRVHFTASASKTAPASRVTNCLYHALVLQPPFLPTKKPSSTHDMSLSLSSKLQPTSFFKASRWPRGHECHIESRSLVLISLSLGGRFGIMGGLRWVPCMEFSELRMMSVIAQSGWGCAACPWRCVCVCMSWMAGYVQSYVFCSLTIQSLLHQQSSLSLPEHYFHSLCHAPILVHTFFSSALVHNFISSSHSRGTVPRLLFCSVIHCPTHLFESFSLCEPLPLSYLALFVSHSPAELPDWSNIYS